MPCENCTWYEMGTEVSGLDGDGGIGLGECRANPPTPAPRGAGYARGTWPRVHRLDYCRLFLAVGTDEQHKPC